jgi:hypothetical protein
MNYPKKGDEKGGASCQGMLVKVGLSVSESRQQSGQQFPQEQIKEKAAANVEKNVGKVKPVKVAVPKKIVGHVGEVLDRPVMPRVGIQKKIMPKGLEDQNRTLDELVCSNQIVVIPYKLPL